MHIALNKQIYARTCAIIYIHTHARIYDQTFGKTRECERTIEVVASGAEAGG